MPQNPEKIITVSDHYESLGFTELKNAPSVYVHVERKIIICCHVDDPLVITETEESEEWIHGEINKDFETNGMRRLMPGSPIDYLSMRLTLDEANVLRVDNSAKIVKFLTDADMENCNPSEVPITSDRLATCLKEGTPLSAQEVTEYQAHIGKFNWLVATTHITLATATSVLASYCSKPTVGSLKAVMQVYHYLQHAKDCCLVNDPECTQGTQRYSDSDFAGMWAVNGDTQSRSGSYIAHNGFPIAWRSAYQDCRATSHGKSASDEYATDAQLAMSTGYAETIAMSETMKMVLHHSCITEELGFKLVYPMVIDVDAAAAKGFADGLGKASV